MQNVLVNRADWSVPAGIEIPDGWVIGNAPRPIRGEITWTGPFRHGIIYAAAPEIPSGSFGWEADDAWLVTFITNAEIARRIDAKLTEYGYTSPDEISSTMAELAEMLQLPWHDEEESPR